VKRSHFQRGFADGLSLWFTGVVAFIFGVIPGQVDSSKGKGQTAANPQVVRRVTPAPVTPTSPPPPTHPAEIVQEHHTPGTITNVFTDTDLKQALGDVALEAGIPIIGDETVQGTVTVSLKDLPLERALDIMVAPGNYAYAKMNGFYLVGKAEPTSPNFMRFATTTVYKPNYEAAERLWTMLPLSEATYVKSSAGELSLLILASPQMRDRILADLRLLDRPPLRIVMQAQITEIDNEAIDQYSFSWLIRNFGLNGSTAGSSFIYSKATQQDLVTLQGLLSNNKAEIKGSPQIMTVEGKEASIEVATEDYFTVITGPANFPYASLQTIKTGIMLKMTPWISDNGDVTVQLSPEVSDALQATSTSGLPLVTARRASTTVRVKDGETIVIGGMQYQNNRRTTSKIPILGDLPLVGSLFRSHNNDIKKTDVVIMITPHIVRDDAPVSPSAGN
jgi:type II secretory pathway component GspD/PulD (secretin)